jgi:hypothetical protein
MAAPARQDLIITRGDTETVVAVLAQDESGTPINIAGRTYTSQLRSTQDSAIIAASFTCTVTDGAAGEVTCVMSPASSGELDPGYFYWDLQENASGVITTVLSGQVTVLADVTR